MIVKQTRCFKRLFVSHETEFKSIYCIQFCKQYLYLIQEELLHM